MALGRRPSAEAPILDGNWPFAHQAVAFASSADRPLLLAFLLPGSTCQTTSPDPGDLGGSERHDAVSKRRRTGGADEYPRRQDLLSESRRVRSLRGRNEGGFLLESCVSVNISTPFHFDGYSGGTEHEEEKGIWTTGVHSRSWGGVLRTKSLVPVPRFPRVPQCWQCWPHVRGSKTR